MLVEAIDFYRLDANRKLDPERRADLGQFHDSAGHGPPDGLDVSGHC